MPFDRKKYEEIKQQAQAQGKTHGLRNCFLILGVIGLFFGGRYFYADQLFPKALKGNVVDMVYVPGENGVDGKLWFQTDDSFYYSNRQETGSSISFENKTLFEKIYRYVYDPVKGEVLERFRTDYDKTPPHPHLYYAKNSVWMVTTSETKQTPDVQVFDPKTGEQTLNIQSFSAKFPQLKAGIAELTLNFLPNAFNIVTRDGQNLVYSLELDAIFADQSAFELALKPSGGKVDYFLLDGDMRKQLYKISGAPKDLTFSSSDLNRSKLAYYQGIEATLLGVEEVYLNGWLVYSDQDLALIIHQDQVADNANRILTAVDAQGKVLFSLQQDELFPELALKKDDPFSDAFFIKNDVFGQRYRDIFVLKMPEVGIMAINLKNGQKLWTFKP